MATTMVPPTPVPGPRPATQLRFVPVRANLMPDEIISGRQIVVVRKQVLLGLGLLVALLLAGYAASWWQTSQANSSLDDAQRQGAAYQSQQSRFGPLVRAQADVLTIQTQLHTAMTDDLSWKTLLTTLRAKAPAGVTFDSVTANITPSTAAAPGPAAGAAGAAAAAGASGQAAVGQVTLSGSAPDKRAVAAYADRLSTAKLLAAPLISSVTSDTSKVKFSMTVVITADALGGRFAAAPAVTGPIPAPTGGH